LPTPFILSHHYRLRSIREAVLFLFDLKHKALLYPEVLESLPSPLAHVPNSPKTKRASEVLARKASLNLKLIPPTIRPFAAEILLAETMAKKENEKLTGLRKIHQLRKMRSNSGGQVLPKPPPQVPVGTGSGGRGVTKNPPISRLNPRLKKNTSLPSDMTRSLIPIQHLSEHSLQTSDQIASTEMISVPHTADTSDPFASLLLVSNSDNIDLQDYSNTESEDEDDE
jgi:hypothetical protein